MANLNSFPDTSCIFMGNPIVYEIEPLALSGSNIAFHRVKMIVTILGHEFELSQPVDENTNLVEFDISGCFTAISEMYDIAPVITRTDYPVFVTQKITVKDIWVEEGVSREGGHFTASNRSAIMGAFSDFERLHDYVTPTFSRKPAYGELVFPGDKVVIPQSTDTLAPASVAHAIPSDAAGTVTIQGRKLYVVPEERNSLQFQFFNSRGCVESVRAFGIDVDKMKTEKSSSVVSRFERFGKFSRAYKKKHVSPSEFTASSGFVDLDWAQWWAYEFCASDRHWMLFDGIWIPCNIDIDESLTIIDRSKVNLCSVQFTVSPDLNGALW